MPEGFYKHLTDKDYIEINNNLAGSEPLEISNRLIKCLKMNLSMRAVLVQKGLSSLI
jgi:hypothetical protein